MPHDITPGNAEDWLRHAKSDLTLATIRLPEGVLFSSLCFHAQQTAEKSIKAVLVHRGVEFPRIHSLARLVDLLPADIVRTPLLLEVSTLSPFATIFRYPIEQDDSDILPEEYARAVQLAQAVYDWAHTMIDDGP